MPFQKRYHVILMDRTKKEPHHMRQKMFERIVASHNGKYDGWETDISPNWKQSEYKLFTFFSKRADVQAFLAEITKNGFKLAQDDRRSRL